METSIYKYQNIKITTIQFIEVLKLIIKSSFWILIAYNHVNWLKVYAEEQQFSPTQSTINAETFFTERHDPTKPKQILKGNQIVGSNNVTEDDEQNLLKLSLIMIRENDKIATINQIALREKEQIAGLEIIKIEDNKVLLQPLANNNLTREQQLQQLATNSKFIRQHIVNDYIELSLPKTITIKPMITVDNPMAINDKKKL